MRYMVFGFLDYYPEGGLDDIVLTTDDIDSVKEHIEWFKTEPELDDMEVYDISNSDNIQVYDTVESKVVYSAYKKEVRGYDFESGRKWKKEIVEEVNLIETIQNMEELNGV